MDSEYPRLPTDVRALLIAGSRRFEESDPEAVLKLLSGAYRLLGQKFDTIIHGGAAGVDRLAGVWAAQRHKPFFVYRALWKKYGKPAGIYRNDVMVNASQGAIILWDGTSKGTEHTISLLKNRAAAVDMYRKAGWGTGPSSPFVRPYTYIVMRFDPEELKYAAD